MILETETSAKLDNMLYNQIDIQIIYNQIKNNADLNDKRIANATTLRVTENWNPNPNWANRSDNRRIRLNKDKTYWLEIQILGAYLPHRDHRLSSRAAPFRGRDNQSFADL